MCIRTNLFQGQTPTLVTKVQKGHLTSIIIYTASRRSISERVLIVENCYKSNKTKMIEKNQPAGLLERARHEKATEYRWVDSHSTVTWLKPVDINSHTEQWNTANTTYKNTAAPWKTMHLILLSNIMMSHKWQQTTEYRKGGLLSIRTTKV